MSNLEKSFFVYSCLGDLCGRRKEPGVSGNSRSRPFPRRKASDSLSRIMGIDFFIPFPFPNFGNAFFSFPSPSRIMGMVFFHSLPVPELWEWIFLIPFPFPNLLFHRRESKRELDYCNRYQASNFSASSTFLKTIILGGKLSQDVQK